MGKWASRVMVESLEDRRMLSGSGNSVSDIPLGPNPPAQSVSSERRVQRPEDATASFSVDEVEQILARAASQARPGQAIVVVDREGKIQGIFTMTGATEDTIIAAASRARTTAAFQSKGDAFTTRTARFIIQDRFPEPVPNTPGGPLYGVQFSSLRFSDVLDPTLTPKISGDPGGIPLFKNGIPAGGIGVAGDGHDVAPRKDLIDEGIDGFNPKNEFYKGAEESDFDEAVALAGAKGLLPPEIIRANQIFLDGLRLPFTKNKAASNNPFRTLDEITTAGEGHLSTSAFLLKTTADIEDASDETRPFTTIGGNTGRILNPIITSNDSGVRLTADDVKQIIAQAVKRARRTRGGIRQPIGARAVVHVSVVDRNGDILGTFRESDATRFSYDVAVQKARTAAFFSDQKHAVSTRAVGFLAQRFFPPGIENAEQGPLFHLQNQLSLRPGNFKGPLKNGITIFPGGVPLYKNGILVGAVGVSGDGVDQDDIIAYSASKGFRPVKGKTVRSDAMTEEQTRNLLRDRMQFFRDNDFNLTDKLYKQVEHGLLNDLDRVHLPYVKFPRNPDV